MLILAVLLGLVLSAFLYLRYRMGNTPDKKSLEAAIDAEVNKVMKSGLFPGIVVGVYKDGRMFTKGYGCIKKGSTLPPGATTVFQIGSVSKLLTASLLQTLCDEGVVSMDATLLELIGGSRRLAPSVQRVTLRQLVTHTSGFPSVPKSLENAAVKMAGEEGLLRDPYSRLGPQYVFDYLATAQDQREPGRFEYSNFGMGLLGHVLEVATGREFDRLVQEKVLMPLGMNSTSIMLTPQMKEELAQGHTPKGVPAPLWTFAALAGAGAYSSTAQDMVQFIQAAVRSGSANSDSLDKWKIGA